MSIVSVSAFIMSLVTVTVKLFCSYWIEGFSSLLVCFAFTFCRLLTFLRYIGVYFTFGLMDYVRYNEHFVIWRFCSIQFSVTLAGQKNIVRYTEDLVVLRFVKSRFHCIFLFLSRRYFPSLFTRGYPRVLMR